MKATLDCLECIARQALRAARVTTDDVEMQRRILNEVVARIPDMDADESPAALSKVVYDLCSGISGKADPYKELKRAQNEFALGLEAELREMIEKSESPLVTALHLSAAGNIIDLGVDHAQTIDVHGAIDQALRERFAVDHTREFMESLAACKDLLLLLDNAGEIVFDKLLIEELARHTKVTAVVKGAPILNDVTLEDAEQVGLTGLCDIIDNGGGFIGSPMTQIPESFKERLRQADMIVGKGQGNYETMDEFPGNVFLILRAKCQIIARDMGVKYGQVALISVRARSR